MIGAHPGVVGSGASGCPSPPGLAPYRCGYPGARAQACVTAHRRPEACASVPLGSAKSVLLLPGTIAMSRLLQATVATLGLSLLHGTPASAQAPFGFAPPPIPPFVAQELRRFGI